MQITLLRCDTTTLRLGHTRSGWPNVAITPTAGTWSEVHIPLATLSPSAAAVTGITWQDTTGGSQPTFYLDDIDLPAKQDASAPHFSGSSVSTRAVPADGTTEFVVIVQVTDTEGPADIATVQLKGATPSPYRCTTTALAMTAPPPTASAVRCLQYLRAPGGELQLSVVAQNQEGNTAIMPLRALAVLASPGGQIPTLLP